MSKQIKSEKFSSARELINELKKGEKSGFVKNFNSETFLNKLQEKHSGK